MNNENEIVKVTKVTDKSVEEVVKELEAEGAEVEQVDPKAIIDQYLTDEKVVARLDEMMIHLSEVSKSKWVSVRELQKKSRIKEPKELYMILDLLVLSKRALSKKVGDITMYRFTLNPNQRKKVLAHYIKELEAQLDGLKKEFNSL